MMLSEHFSLREFTKSDYAIRHGLDNIPSSWEIECMRALCENVMEPIRLLCGEKPIIITSGYRSKVVNAGIGGSKTSQHKKGQAADFEVLGMSNKAVINLIRKSEIPVDQCIAEFGEEGWNHVSYAKDSVKQRHEFLTAVHVAMGGVRYLPFEEHTS